MNVDCVEESYCCCYKKCCCKRFLQKLQWAFEENTPRQILRHTLLELVLPDDAVNAAVVAVEEAAVAAEHSNLAEEAVLHNKIVV